MRIMNKLQNKLKKANKDNKGFSLVELIIVIAIMAILVGIVGTQVIPYIQKSKKAKDIQKISALCTAATTAYSSNTAKLTDDSYTITINATGVSVASGTEKATLENEFKTISGVSKLKDVGLESKDGGLVTTITIVCKNEAPMVTVTTDAGDFEPISSK